MNPVEDESMMPNDDPFTRSSPRAIQRGRSRDGCTRPRYEALWPILAAAACVQFNPDSWNYS